MSQRLKNKTSLITGATSGIGFATAKRFVEEGAKVIFCGRKKESVEAIQAELGANAIGVVADVAHMNDIDQLVAKAKAEFGNLDIVFANAGIANFSPVDQVTEEFYDSHFNTNTKGLFFTVQKSLPLLKEGGSIILNASIVATKGFPAASVYSATKAAVRSFARCWVSDLKDRKVRVNVISPGPIETPIFDKMGLPKENTDQMAKEFASMVPLGRFGKAEEIASAAAFLASEEASFVNGVELAVDGGLAQI